LIERWDSRTRDWIQAAYQYDDLYRLTREYCKPDAGSSRKEYGYEYA